MFGVRPIILETSILRYELKGKARACPNLLRVVLGPCAQYFITAHVRPRRKKGQKQKTKRNARA